MQKRALRILGIVFLAFLVGVAIVDPFASATPKGGNVPAASSWTWTRPGGTARTVTVSTTSILTPAAKPPLFQVLANNLASDNYGGSWIGGVAGYDTVTIILSAACTSDPCAASRNQPLVYIYFQTGSTITETPEKFSWSVFPSPMAQPYTVPSGAETIIVLVASMEPTFTYFVAISLG